ncbi:MAG: fused DSP-PTPase phosphatase/NAD kinase-like protein [Parashewanella sp.]
MLTFTVLKKIRLVALVLLNTAFAVFSASAVEQTAIEALSIKNLKTHDNNQFSGGQPTQQQLAKLAKLGVQNIINLRPLSEQNWNEKQYVESLGMKYYSIPVAGLKGLTTGNADKLKRLLDKVADQSAFVHCASGNRVGALKAISVFNKTANIENAIAEGKNWGLTKLEPIIRKQLN